MKKSISKIWGISLVVMVLASLLVVALPTSAGELAWTAETIPTTSGNVLVAAGTDMVDYAIAGDGTMYAVTGGTTIYKSVDGGNSWTPVTQTGVTAMSATQVAVAPDNSSYVAISDATPAVFISTNGGSTWGSLGTPQETGGAACATLNDLAISALATSNYVAVAGQEAGSVANVWYYALGIGGAWKETNTKDGFHTTAASGNGTATNALAVTFSPNFTSDLVLTAVTVDASATYLELFSLSTKLWNNAASLGTGYFAQVWDGTNAITNATRARIALAPDYLGGDETTRIAFISILATTSARGGVYRMTDTNPKGIKTATNMFSVAFDGTNLVSGASATNAVYRSADPLVSSPTFFGSAATKSPSGTENTTVAWSGTSVVATATGDESAFAVSMDNGKSFNDISFIDTAITNVEDVAVAADGSKVYMLTDDGTTQGDTTMKDLSLWRYDTAWQRVLSVAINDGTTAYAAYIVRIAPDNGDVVYVAKKAAKVVYYTIDAGQTRWYNRTAGDNVKDLAVESVDVAYIGVDSAGTVSKTSNGGFTWATAKNAQLASGNIATIKVISENNLVVGSSAGYVSYSTDGNSTWTKISQLTAAGAVQVTASSLASGGYIYAATAASGAVYRWPIGQANSVPWKSLAASTPTGYVGYGIELEGSVLYVATADATNNVSAVMRTLLPTISEPSAGYWSTLSASAEFSTTPSALRVSTGSNKLWAANTVAAAAALYAYTDTLATAGPTLSLPADATQIMMNPISGNAYDVSFQWARPSKATRYDLWISFDSAFTQVAVKVVAPTATTTTTSSTPAYIVGPNGTTTLSYMPGTTYYWRVAVSADGPIASPWSEVRSFTIEPGAAIVPVIGAPINGGTVTSTTPAFSWNPVAGTSMYEFQLATDPSFLTPLVTSDLSTTGIRITTKLTDGMTYFWRVKALEPVEGDWSTIANFTVAVPVPPAPPITVPPAPTPTIVISQPPATTITIPPQPTPPPAIGPGYIWAIIIIGAVLVIAIVVLIVRTRRTV